MTADYLERAAKLGRSAGISAIDTVELPESRHRQASQRKVEEAQKLLAAIPPASTVIALDETGTDIKSSALSAKMRKLMDSGQANLAFVIGGPDGLASEVTSPAASVIAFGRQTWPHRLMRILVAEQIYRAVTIMVNHPYHRA